MGLRVLLISANRETLPSPVVPLGVLSVAAAIRDRHDVRVLDLCFEQDPLAAVDRAVRDHAPDVVGVGIRNLRTNAYDECDRLQAEYADVVSAVRRATPSPIVLGGAGYSLRPEEVMVRLGADHGVVGPGEHAFAEMLAQWESGERPARIVRSAPFRSSHDLDALALPARDLADPRYYAFDGVENIQTKRGCAFACSYCDYPDLEGRFVRVRDPERVAAEVEARSRVPGVTHVFFVDSVFNVPRSHALAICRALEARGAPLPWVCYGSPAAFDDELVAAMARAGCVGVEIGSDAGTDAMLARLGKPFTVADITTTRRLFAQHGIRDCHSFVLGAFDETVVEARETLDFVARLAPDAAVFIVFHEDREANGVHRARHRTEILALLAREAPLHPGWSVPELGIRFGQKLTRYLQRHHVRGPAWLQLAGGDRARTTAA